MLAGIFAAAMSSLSSTINSLSSSTCYDLLEIDRREGMTEEKKLVLSRRVSLAWTMVIIVVSMSFNYTTGALVEVGLSIASVTYGGMMGMFFLGRLKRDFNEWAALGGMTAGIIVTASDGRDYRAILALVYRPGIARFLYFRNWRRIMLCGGSVSEIFDYLQG